MLRGKRGRTAAELPEYVEVQADGRVRCKLCLQYNKLDYRANWVLRASFAGHAKLPVHLKAVENQQRVQASNNTPQTFAVPQYINLSTPMHESPAAAARLMAEEDLLNNLDACYDGFDPLPESQYEEERDKFDALIADFGSWGQFGSEENEHAADMVDMVENWLDEQEEERILSSLQEEETDDIVDDHLKDINIEATSWYPYPSKLACLLDMIDNLPRLRISSSLMKVLIWLLRQIGVKKVPSFDALRKIQKSVRETNIAPTIHTKTPKGNAYSFNDPRSLVANDWANPLTAKHIRRYPVIPKDGVVSEVWHASKWRQDLDRHILSPMFDAGNGRHYFIDEPAELTDGRIVIPIRWLEDEDKDVWFDAWEVKVNEQTNLSTIIDERVVTIKASALRQNMLDLEGNNRIPTWCPVTTSKGHATRMPNPDRALAAGLPIYCSFIDVFGDDVSGNRSKSWNKHWNIYITHRNLPRDELQKQSHMHFISTSTHASVPEQFHGIKEIIESTHTDPIRTRSAVDGCETCLKIYCNCGPGDNPSQSETCGHIGSQGNFPCRKCKVGGSQKDKEATEGFESFFSPGESRSSEEILKHVEAQVEAACLGVAQTVKDLQTNTGVKDMFTQSWIDDLITRSRALQITRSATDVQDELMKWVEDNQEKIYNPFLTLKGKFSVILPLFFSSSVKTTSGFDVARDTPVEILHTVLLGIVKYAWHGSHTTWNDSHKKIFSQRLQATDVTGLTIPAIRASYIMQYANSLIGRQLKTLAQVNAFHTYDLVDSLQFSLIKAMGELSALLWVPEIHNLEEYLADVEIAAANVLDIAALIDPSKIILKIKYHLLAHLRQDIIRFGPLLGVATETYESFNMIFRFCSILSNHLAPSRDISIQLAEQETLKHLLSGGYWKSKDGIWKQSGEAVRRFLGENTFLQVLLGYGRPVADSPVGFIQLQPNKRGPKGKKIPRPSLALKDTLAAQALNVPDVMRNEGLKWHRGKSVLSAVLDECVIGSWVYATCPLTPLNSPITGRIIEILQESAGGIAYVVLDVFQVSRERHDFFGMPILMRRMEERSIYVVAANTIMFNYNVQHDCRAAECSASGNRKVRQERVDSDVNEAFVEHKPLERFLINTHAFHNAHLIRRVLGRDLTAPIPFSENREDDHANVASKLRDAQAVKRTKTAEKKKATAAEKRRAGDASESRSSTTKRRKAMPLLDGTDDMDVDVM